ncbi:MAG: zinc ABC transporter substrate-binding protein [Candidatus Rokubacteria bacterium]|nr:zinc ABC transporter substrate-binding protein [Candidatus Rokubacteria bacterium]
MRSAIASLLATILAAAGCQDAPPPPPAATAPAAPTPKPLVVASFYTLAEFTRQVGGDRIQVVTLVPPGVEPHDWEASPRDMAQLPQAKLLIYNGAGFEGWMEKLARELPSHVLVNTTRGLPLVEVGHVHGEGKGHTNAARAHPEKAQAGKAAARPDPHVWLDPVLARAQVETIRAGLAQADPANASAYAAGAAAYAAKLDALDEAYRQGLASCKRRQVVVSHAAFSYLTTRYNLEMIPVMGLTPDAEPSPKELAGIVRFMKQHKVQYVFFETLVNAKLAETLARETGAQTLVLNPVEGLTKEEAASGKSYLDLMEENLKNLRTALDCA